MPSRALQEWRTTQRADLDRLDAAVRGASGHALRQQLVDAYILALAGQFQLYCRTLHTDAVAFAANNVSPASAAPIVNALAHRRLLDHGNAHSSALGADFEWLGPELWTALVKSDQRNRLRRTRLDQLNAWRNAVAHQARPLAPRDAAAAASAARTLRWARLWRADCSALAHQMDRYVQGRLTSLLGIRPW